jgi:hypothetical protein
MRMVNLDHHYLGIPWDWVSSVCRGFIEFENNGKLIISPLANKEVYK